MTKEPHTIPEHSVETIPEFMDVVQKVARSEKVLFRGQRHQWELKPKLGRIKPRTGTILETERQMLSEFKRRSIPWLKSLPSDDLEWLALAQHHGMATRLLDWTENPLAALWFAVRNPPEPGDGKSAPGVVWCLETPNDRILPQAPMLEVEANIFAAKKTMVYRPRHISPRIVAQAGWFTVHSFLVKEKRFGVFERHPIFKGTLTKIQIPGAKFASLRMTLASLGTNDATLFPDLVGLCDQIERDHSIATDEKRPRTRL